MKILFLLAILAVSAFCLPNFWQGKQLNLRNEMIASLSENAENHVSPQVFNQLVDHFQPANDATFRMRFWENKQYAHGPNAPVFFMLGGESAGSSFWVERGAMVEYGETEGAYLVNIEHRYYGESQPFADQSVEHLTQLSSEQALADNANFITWYYEKNGLNFKDNRLIIFGGSYSGNLTAWFRTKYPHLAYGAIASSAPLLAVLDFHQYYEVVAKSMETSSYGLKCVDQISESFITFHSMLKSNKKQQLLNDFHGIANLDNKYDANMFFENVVGLFAGVVQYNDEIPGRADIQGICDNMMSTTNAYQGLIEAYNYVNNYPRVKSDMTYMSFVEEMRGYNLTSPSVTGSMRQWMYQTCSEFGYYQRPSGIFGQLLPFEAELKFCRDVYGIKFENNAIYQNAKETNKMYGARSVGGSRIVFPNGDIDPWHALSLIDSTEPERLSVLIHGTAHCANEMPSSSRDPQALVDARKIIAKHIHEWCSN